MEQCEERLKKYLAVKYSKVDPLSIEGDIDDIQAYASAKSCGMFGDGLLLEKIKDYLLKAESANTLFIFWLTCYSEGIKIHPPKPSDLSKLLNTLFRKEDMRLLLMEKRIDLEMIKDQTIEFAELLLQEVEKELQAVKGNICSITNEGPYRWLTHLLKVSDIKNEEICKRIAEQALNLIRDFHNFAKYFPAYQKNIFTSPLMKSSIRLLLEIEKVAEEFPLLQNAITNSLWGFCKNNEFTLREKIELCHTFHSYFKTSMAITNSKMYWDILSDSLTVEDPVVRKYAITIVKDELQLFLSYYDNEDKEMISDL